MRAGGCVLQQALTAEAAGVVKQAVVLAKQRGHAQVTPLHVANTMLAAPSGSFRAACLESNSHPLQCKALELCFNVALNRLPASSNSSNPMLGHHHHQSPSISNALVAAFKRAQAHQRRGGGGSVEAQQQTNTLLAVRIELEQLIISILDDPSVSRVMREAGFLSTQVKSNVEKAVSSSSDNSSTPSPPNGKSKENNIRIINDERKITRNEDVNIVVENLLVGRKRKSLVLVGECISSLESTVKVLMDKVDKGEIPENLRQIKFITIPPLYSFCNLGRDEVEQKIGELTCLVKGLLGKGVVLYLGDFKWISDYRVSLLGEDPTRYYCSVEHVIMEIGRLVWGIGESEKFWLMGIATFQTYMRCRNGCNSLENVWGLHPVTIPANCLGFSLVSERDEQAVARNGIVENNRASDQQLITNGDAKLSCCTECSSKFEDEARNLQITGITNEPTFSSLPSWLKDESRRLNNQNQNSDAIKELCRKWNSFCSSAHKQQPKTLTFTSCFSFDQQNPDLARTCFPSPDPISKDGYQHWTPNPILHIQEINERSRNSYSSNSGSSSDHVMEIDYAQKFKEFNAENLNILCNALEKKFPRQKDIIPEIAGTILQCRSGMLRRKDQTRGNNDNNNNINDHVKKETWLFFLGPDGAQTKERVSKELAKVVFGSYSSFVSISSSSSFVSTMSSDTDCRNKQGRDEENCKSYIEKFARAVSKNPHRVFFLEGLEQADHCSLTGIEKAIEKGRIGNGSGEEFGFFDAIIVLSCERFVYRSSSSSKASSGSEKPETENGDKGKSRTCVSLDLNLSCDDEAVEDDGAVDDFGVFESVDRRVVFKFQGL